ncbi:DMT family transporter [Paraphotobacterium marinum]|uniref:DMT family transporter n=1 Tax=Paraphotobacterium marinum TaxID=1755811 RepID=UPI00131403E0|nr:DMT family transporter [Paraphotobacterium marinum]
MSALRKNIGAYFVLGIIGITGLNGSILYRTKISKIQGIGMLISFIGVAIVLCKGSLENIIHLKFTSGDLIMLGGLLCWTIYNVCIHKYVKDSTTVQTTTYTMIFGTLGLMIVAFFTNDHLYNIFEGQSPKIISDLFYIGTIGTVLPQLFWINGTKKIGAHHISIYFNFMPVFTVFITIISGHFPNILVLLGIGVVILGVLTSRGAIKLPRRYKLSRCM